MLWIGENWPAADSFPGESREDWVMRGAPTKPIKWFIWMSAGPGEDEPLAGPFDDWQSARDAADKKFPCVQIFDSNPFDFDNNLGGESKESAMSKCS